MTHQRRRVVEHTRIQTRHETIGLDKQTSPDDGWESASPQPLRHVDQRWLRRNNRALVLACIREHGPISRVRIAQRTELSRTTVSAIARALLQEGVIREGARSSSTRRGGRRAILLSVTSC